VKVFILKR